MSEGGSSATFTVSLSGGISRDVTVDDGTANGSTTSPLDFDATAGTLTFQPGGSATQTITVLVVDDSDVEGVESSLLNLTNGSGAIVADGQGVATVNDNDASISNNDTLASEGNLAKGKKNAGNVNYKDMIFVVSLSNPVDQPVSVSWSTSDVTTTADNDYESGSGVLTIAAGSTSGTITVRVIGDNDQETDERKAYLVEACGGDTALEQRVERPLAACAEESQFLEKIGSWDGKYHGGQIARVRRTCSLAA